MLAIRASATASRSLARLGGNQGRVPSGRWPVSSVMSAALPLLVRSFIFRRPVRDHAGDLQRSAPSLSHGESSVIHGPERRCARRRAAATRAERRCRRRSSRRHRGPAGRRPPRRLTGLPSAASAAGIARRFGEGQCGPLRRPRPGRVQRVTAQGMRTADVASASGRRGGRLPVRIAVPAAPARPRPPKGSASTLTESPSARPRSPPKGDLLIVEGAGGLLVPYAAGLTCADIAARLGLPLLVVARTPWDHKSHRSHRERGWARLAGGRRRDPEPDDGR